MGLFEFFRRRPRAEEWPAGIPRLYPTLNAAELSDFLTDREYARLKRVPRVMVFPFDAPERPLGLALSRLLLRDLLLVPGLSVRGPEDVPTEPLSAFREDNAYVRSHEAAVGGTLERDNDSWRLRLEIRGPDLGLGRPELSAANPVDLVVPAGDAVAAALKAPLTPVAREGRRHGRPASLESLRRFGRAAADRRNPDVQREVVALRRSDPGFSLPASLLDSESAGGKAGILNALDADPFDANLRFSAFIAVWISVAPQPEALQFVRQAIELSPGHGKAHMCAGHAAHPSVDMIRHYRLGYRLLPGNPFAVSNLLLNLKDRPDADPGLLIELAHEGIGHDEEDPSNYHLLIEILEKQGEFRKAIEVAESLRDLLGPPLNERTKYCYEQNPQRKKDLEDGTFDPARELDATLASLRRRLDASS